MDDAAVLGMQMAVAGREAKVFGILACEMWGTTRCGACQWLRLSVWRRAILSECPNAQRFIS